MSLLLFCTFHKEKKTQYTYYTREALENIARDVEYFAKKEGLTAHAKSAVVRLED